jgi:hypothetical protein
VNGVLHTLRVKPPRLLGARKGRLVADGVAIRLLAGWSGRIEIPADRHAARLVLRVARGDVHVDLLGLPGGQGARYGRLPVALTGRDIIRRGSLLIARRVFSTAGAASTSPLTSPRPTSWARRIGCSQR